MTQKLLTNAALSLGSATSASSKDFRVASECKGSASKCFAYASWSLFADGALCCDGSLSILRKIFSTFLSIASTRKFNAANS